MNEWIGVDERLPDFDGIEPFIVLIACWALSQPGKLFISTAVYWKSGTFESYNQKVFPAYWAPLPEPPTVSVDFVTVPGESTTLWAFPGDGRAWYSVDDGKTWTRCEQDATQAVQALLGTPNGEERCVSG